MISPSRSTAAVGLGAFRPMYFVRHWSSVSRRAAASASTEGTRSICGNGLPRGYLYATPAVCVPRPPMGAFPDPQRSRGRAPRTRASGALESSRSHSISFCGSPFARSLELKPRRHARNRHGQLYSESISAIALAASSVIRSLFVVTVGKRADPSEWQKQGNAVCPFLRCQRPWSAWGRDP
jgi:hypothetical protein